MPASSGRSSANRWSLALAVVVLVASGLTLAGRPTVGTAGASAAAASAGPTSRFVVRGLAPTPDGRGYWLVASDGGVFAFGDAGFYGSTGSLVLKRPIVGMAATPDGHGYWLVASDGGVFAFGDAGFYGSTGNLLLNRPIVGMAATPDGHGYWLVAADGGIFAFGDAGFYGSTGSLVLNRPVVGMAPDPDGHGYWLVAADGGIFAFGDAPFLGSTGSLILNRPIVGMDLDRADGGYRLVAADGGVFTFRASFAGSAVGQLRRPAVGTASHGAGYWVVTQGGSVSAFGGAGLYGSVSVLPLAGLTVAIDPGHDGGNGAAAGFISRPIDGGNFTEPCDTVGTETATGYPEHAFNFDVAVRLEALLQAQGAVVVMTRSDDAGVGPCVDTRAAIGNASGAAAAISIHADGGPVSGRGFDVIEPAPVVSPISDNTAIVGPSAQLAADVRNQFAAVTGEQVSDYSGTGGIDQRNNLGGLNLSTVPKVLIECANMQNPTDAALTESAGWRQQAAQGLADGLATYLEAQQVP